MNRTQYNKDIYNIMSDILERTECCDIYWENWYTTLCGFKQLLNPSNSCGGCGHLCPYSFNKDCVIKNFIYESLWSLK